VVMRLEAKRLSSQCVPDRDDLPLILIGKATQHNQQLYWRS
jgi:hypothetical protein